ncbi:MAG: cobalt ECF transporter T component CbiQ [Oscillospiraceae bacterium]|jgi:cobalt/nickel transport system permease protein|nr:cobalt ECF transporter T component CbiQ [Oscillospiraceae bacterium]
MSAGAALSLETLSMGGSPLHRVHPGVKMVCAFALIVLTLSFGRTDVAAMLPFLLYPSVAIGITDIPVGLLARRMAAALPFAAFAGISNLLSDHAVMFRLGGLAVTGGMAACAGILLRTLLSVSYALVLIAATPFPEITAQMRRIHIPGIFIQTLEMTYRYIGTLTDETRGLTNAYRLRAGADDAGVRLARAGSLVGGLFLRTADRAERILAAMRCRGFEANGASVGTRPAHASDWIFLAAVCGSGLLLRIVDVPALIASVIAGMG